MPAVRTGVVLKNVILEIGVELEANSSSTLNLIVETNYLKKRRHNSIYF